MPNKETIIEVHKNGIDGAWIKNEPGDKIWWFHDYNVIGNWIFSFDLKHIFYMFRDYPWKLSPEQKAIFDKENPYWADFFKDRTESK